MSTTPLPSPAAATGPPVAREEPELLSALEHTVSASRLTVFLQCRLKFYFRHVLCLPKPKTPALHVGHTVHGVLKAWHRARWLGHGLALKELHDTCDALWQDQEAQPVDW